MNITPSLVDRIRNTGLGIINNNLLKFNLDQYGNVTYLRQTELTNFLLEMILGAVAGLGLGKALGADQQTAIVNGAYLGLVVYALHFTLLETLASNMYDAFQRVKRLSDNGRAL